MPIDTTKPTIRDHLPKLLKLLDLADKHDADACSISITQYGYATLHLEDDSTAAVDAIADELGIPRPAEKYSGIYIRRGSDYMVFCGYSAATCSCGTPCDHTSASS
jgi:hypothetical protein